MRGCATVVCVCGCVCVRDCVYMCMCVYGCVGMCMCGFVWLCVCGQGWTKAYEFSFGDLRAGVNILEGLLEQVRRSTPLWSTCPPICVGTKWSLWIDPQMLRVYVPAPTQSGSVSDPRAIPWKFVHGLMENAIYGGRVDNAIDIRILRAYIQEVFNPENMVRREHRGVCDVGDASVQLGCVCGEGAKCATQGPPD